MAFFASDTVENFHKSIRITTKQTTNIKTKTTHQVSLSYLFPKLPRTRILTQEKYFLEKSQVSRQNFKSCGLIGMEQKTNTQLERFRISDWLYCVREFYLPG